ncbi:hypothetical protein F3Y22_tig00111783pilonHSYRG00569 [Hibiscus syriacus]|uniref:Uncharacterized protein n=1 Tax=Hibiscus syriacus TaxID=106335 RepID=A0A6A2YD51_HIBSY|nr:hypothetical protein F3Y22_tig00111783pilonHSYRG00569 [Hibiscus syriacus]
MLHSLNSTLIIFFLPMDTYKRSPLKPWKKGPTRAKAALKTLPASTEASANAPGANGWPKYESPRNETASGWALSPPRRKPPWLPINNPSNRVRKFKWIPSKNFISMFPSSTGLLNINAQPSVHVIHQRLQELKQNGVSKPSSSSSEDHRRKEKDVEVSQEKPQIDLHEFLQQLGIKKEEKKSEESDDDNDNIESSTAMDSSMKDYDDFAAFAENNFNWVAMIDMHGELSPASKFMMITLMKKS